MKTFTNFLDFATHLQRVMMAEVVAVNQGLVAAAKLIQKTAQAEIGHLQPQYGHYAAWAELADSTKRDKARLGYVFNKDYNPLLRTGELRESIHYTVQGLDALIGSASDILVYQECGTAHIPPRPVLGLAAYRKEQEVLKILGSSAFYAIAATSFVSDTFSDNAYV